MPKMKVNKRYNNPLKYLTNRLHRGSSTALGVPEASTYHSRSNGHYNKAILYDNNQYCIKLDQPTGKPSNTRPTTRR